MPALRKVSGREPIKILCNDFFHRNARLLEYALQRAYLELVMNRNHADCFSATVLLHEDHVAATLPLCCKTKVIDAC